MLGDCFFEGYWGERRRVMIYDAILIPRSFGVLVGHAHRIFFLDGMMGCGMI